MTEIVELTTVEEGGAIEHNDPLVPSLPSAADLIPEMKHRDVAIAERYLVHFDLNRAIKEVCGYEDVEGQKGNYPPVVYTQSYKLRQDTIWLQFVAARLNESSLTANRVLIELAAIASFSLEDVMNDSSIESNTPMFDFAKARRTGALKCVKKIEYTKTGGVRFEPYDKIRALELLAKHFNLLKEAEVKVDNYIITVVRDDD